MQAPSLSLAAGRASLAEDHDLVVAAAREAGALALTFFRAPCKSWTKAGDSVVTEADIAADELLRERLLGARPDYGWLSEETRDNPARLDRERVFIVDPIDGTSGFIRGEPHFTICVAVVEAGRPVAAAVFNPARDEMFEAAAGGGARLNGREIAPSGRSDLAGARLVGSRRIVKECGLAGFDPPVRVEYRNSLAYRLVLVANGHFDAAISLWNASDWDIAAGDLIVHEAGGRLTDHAGRPYRYNQRTTRHAPLLCAGEPLHSLLRERMRRSGRRA